MICFNTWPFKWREQETLFDRPSEQEQAEAEMRRLRSKQEPQVPSCTWKHTKSAEGWRRQRQLYSATCCQDERSAMIKQRVEEGVKRCLYCWSLFRWESAPPRFWSKVFAHVLDSLAVLNLNTYQFGPWSFESYGLVPFLFVISRGSWKTSSPNWKSRTFSIFEPCRVFRTVNMYRVDIHSRSCEDERFQTMMSGWCWAFWAHWWNRHCSGKIMNLTFGEHWVTRSKLQYLSHLQVSQPVLRENRGSEHQQRVRKKAAAPSGSLAVWQFDMLFGWISSFENLCALDRREVLKRWEGPFSTFCFDMSWRNSLSPWIILSVSGMPKRPLAGGANISFASWVCFILLGISLAWGLHNFIHILRHNLNGNWDLGRGQNRKCQEEGDNLAKP